MFCQALRNPSAISLAKILHRSACQTEWGDVSSKSSVWLQDILKTQTRIIQLKCSCWTWWTAHKSGAPHECFWKDGKIDCLEKSGYFLRAPSPPENGEFVKTVLQPAECLTPSRYLLMHRAAMWDGGFSHSDSQHNRTICCTPSASICATTP